MGLEFADTKLARIQFAGALVDAMLAGEISDPVPLAQAAELIAADQSDGGSWSLDTSGSIGSPATYGTALATWAALRVLTRAGVPDLAAVIARADAWVRGVQAQTVIDAAAVVLALGVADDTAAIAQRQRCLALIMEGRAPSGAWGPYLTSAVEPFDTALVLLALQPLLGQPELVAPAIDAVALREAVDRGRAFSVPDLHLALDPMARLVLDTDRAPQQRVVERLGKRDDQLLHRATRRDLETPGGEVQRCRICRSHDEPFLERRLERFALSIGPGWIYHERVGSPSCSGRPRRSLSSSPCLTRPGSKNTV